MTVPDEYVRLVGEVRDIDDAPLTISVDYDCVAVGNLVYAHRFARAQAEEFAQLFVAACWEASANAERMRQEAAVDT